MILDGEPRRRRLAAPVGHPAAVHPGLGRRASRAAPPRPAGRSPTKDEFADYLERMPPRFDLPVRLNTRVTRCRPDGDGTSPPPASAHRVRQRRRRARGPSARRRTCRIRRPSSTRHPAAALQRVPATFAAGRRHRCSWSARPTPGATSPSRLPPFTPLSSSGRIPARSPSPSSHRGQGVLPGHALRWTHVLTRSTPLGRKALADYRHGGRGCGCSSATLPSVVSTGSRAVAGVRTAGPDRRRPMIDAGTVVWCTGFRQAFHWIAFRYSTRTAGHGSTAARWTACPGCSSAGCGSSTPPPRCRSTAPAGTPHTSPGSSRSARRLCPRRSREAVA